LTFLSSSLDLVARFGIFRKSSRYSRD